MRLLLGPLLLALVLAALGCGTALRRPAGLPPLAGGSERSLRNPAEMGLLAAFTHPALVVAHGDRRRPLIALTFDDGPDAQYTPQVFALLHRYGARATFFFTGHRAEVYPEVVRQAARDGHEVGNHSYDHPDLTRLAPAGIVRQLTRTDAILTRLVGQRPRLFRPPYGNMDQTIADTAGRMGYRIVLWSVDSRDWQSLSREQILARVLPTVRPGAILLFHSASGGPTERLEGTLAALPAVLDAARARGLWPARVSDLVQPAPPPGADGGPPPPGTGP